MHHYYLLHMCIDTKVSLTWPLLPSDKIDRTTPNPRKRYLTYAGGSDNLRGSLTSQIWIRRIFYQSKTSKSTTRRPPHTQVQMRWKCGPSHPYIRPFHKLPHLHLGAQEIYFLHHSHHRDPNFFTFTMVPSVTHFITKPRGSLFAP
jgi:hypothetical protein